jgi:hypothetical protein
MKTLRFFSILFLMSIFMVGLSQASVENQHAENEKAKTFALGSSSSDLINHVGAPTWVLSSTDGNYEIYMYETTLPYSSYLVATVEKSSGRVLEISHGEDWKDDRRLSGAEVPSTMHWDYTSKRPYEG